MRAAAALAVVSDMGWEGVSAVTPGEDVTAGADPGERLRRLAAQAAGGDPTGWFEHLYAAAERGEAVVPWDRGSPHWMLVDWAGEQPVDGTGRSALVVGCGLGADAEYVAGRGFATVAFDISPTAVAAARRRYPDSSVDYRTADLLAAPADWRGHFDLVVESQTVQALPDPPRADAIARVGEFVAPGGTLLVICLARDTGDVPGEHAPWAITRAEIEAFCGAGLRPVRIEDIGDYAHQPPGRRWRAEFRRPVA